MCIKIRIPIWCRLLRKLKAQGDDLAQYIDLLPDSEADDEPVATKKSKRKAIDPYHADLLKQREDIVSGIDAVSVVNPISRVKFPEY